MSRSSIFLRLACSAAASCLLACGEADDEPGSGVRSPPATHVPGCETLDHAACDIAHSDCQERLAKLAACVWGGPEASVVTPPVGFVSQEEFEQLVLEGLAERSEDAEPDRWDQALVLLGFAAAAMLTDEQTAQRSAERVAGYYDDEDAAITVVTRESGSPDFVWDSVVLLHEYFHALQDATNDLAALTDAQPATADASLALSNLVEGEAEFHTTRALSAMLGLDVEALDLTAAIENRRERYEASVFQEQYPFLQISGLVNYGYGPQFVNSVWQEQGRAGVRQLFDAPPTSLYPVFALVHGAEPVEFQPVEFEAPSVPEGVDASVYTSTSFGPVGPWVLFRGADLEPALAWRGDRLDIFELADGATALRWQFEFANATEAAKLGAASIALRVQTRAVERRAEVLASTGAIPDWLPVL